MLKMNDDVIEFCILPVNAQQTMLTLLVLTITLPFTANSLSFTSYPVEGSTAGGTWMTLSFNGCNLYLLHLVNFGNGSHLEIFMSNPLMPPIPCDIDPLYAFLSSIKCKTRPSFQEATYKLEVYLNGQSVNQDTENFFTYSPALTPKVHGIYPSFGIPGSIIEVSGWIMAETSESYDFNIDFIDGPVFMTSKEEHWFTVCSLANKESKSSFPIQVENGFGTFQCQVEGNSIGSYNVSFSVFNKGKSAVSKSAWLISAKQDLFLFQTFSEITSVTPVFGSKGGGTDITISGNSFHHPTNISITGVPCKITFMSPKVIVCTTGPYNGRQRDSYQGNRGLLYELWKGSKMLNVTDISSGTNALWVPNAHSSSDNLLGLKQPFSAKLSGFFVAPETNNYTFWIYAANKASLFFSHSEDAQAKVQIASIPQGMSTWSDHWEMDWDERWKQKSYKMELVKDKKYYIEMLQFGSGPESTMEIGVQIHNTWLNPDVVNTYQREKHQIVAHSSRLPDIQMMTFSGEGLVHMCWGNVSSKPIHSNSTAQQLQAAIEKMLSVQCTLENSAVDIFVQNGFEEDASEIGTDGRRASWSEPYCGRVSILNPNYILKVSKLQSRYRLNMYTHVCFAYKGYMEDSMIVSFSYKNNFSFTVSKNHTCQWKYNTSSPESWKFVCTDLWDCVNGSGALEDIHSNSPVFVDQINLLPDNTKNWFYIDEIIVANGSTTVLQIIPGPARPGGHLLETVTVTGSYPTYNLISLVANCAQQLPLIKICGALLGPATDNYLHQSLRSEDETIALTVQRLQEASPPIGGTFSIRLLETIIPGISVHISSSQLRKILRSNTDNYTAQYINTSDFKVTKDVNTCYHIVWTLTWTDMTGDIPNIISVYSENLTGLNASVKSRVIFDGGVFISPIFGDMLSTVHILPQVTVHVNDIPAKCSGSCSFEYLQEFTSLVTDVYYSTGNGCDFRVDIAGSGFMNNSLDLDIRINKTNCYVIHANTSVITCCSEKVLPLGVYSVSVHVKPYGFAVNGTGNNICLYVTPKLSEITPKAISQIGGQLMTITGIPFDQVTQVFFGSQSCQIIANNSTTVKCLAPAQDENVYEVDVKMKIGEQSVVFTKRIMYEPSLNPVILSLSPNVTSFAGGQTLYIMMSLTNTSESLNIKVEINNTDAKIKNVTTNGIHVILPPLPTGSYNISVTINGIHIKALGFEPSIRYTLETYRIEPCCGSFFGGTIITIFGNGFSMNSTLISIFVGTKPCDIVISTDETIMCKTPPWVSPTEVISIPVPLSIYILNVSAVHINPMEPNRNNLIFLYQKQYTPLVTNLSWLIEDENITFQVTGSNLTNAYIQLNNLMCRLEHHNANAELSNTSCQIPVTDFEVDSYPIIIYNKQMGYANLTSDLTIFELVPHVDSISPVQGPSCGGTLLTILGSFYKSTNNSIFVDLTREYFCSVISFNYSTVECVIHTNWMLVQSTVSTSVSVIVNGIRSACRGNCIFDMLFELTPLVNEVKPNMDFTSLFILGEKLSNDLIIVLDNSLRCKLTLWNETTMECHDNISPGNHTLEVLNAGNGHWCLSHKPFHFATNSQIAKFYPKYFGILGGGLLTIEGTALQGRNITLIFVGSDLCANTTSNNTMISCIVPPGNGILNITVQIDSVLFIIGTIQYQEQYTPVVQSVLHSDSNNLTLIVSRITDVLNIHIFVGNSSCTSLSGNSSFLQCSVPQLPAGIYDIKFHDAYRGWAFSNAKYTSPLVIMALKNNIGCTNKRMLHIHGNGFSPGHTSVSICETPCEILEYLSTPSRIYCFNWQLHKSLGFLCDLTYEEDCYRPRYTYIHCDVTVQVGTIQESRSLAYVHICNDPKCSVMSLQAKHDPFYQTTIIGLFISPKVERDEVLIYNSSCSVTMATEAEMECQGPNQPITAKITEIRKNWGQSTQDVLPKFCSLWSKNSSWLSGHPPVDGDNVTVERRQTLVLDTNTSVLNLLHVKGGKLLFLAPGPVQLHAHYILVSEGGELQVGTLAQPFTGKAQISLYGSPFSSPFYPYGVKFLAVRNATISMHGWVPQVTSTHLALNAHAHDIILAVMEPVDWRAGYNIVICGVDFRGYKMHEEILTIENVNNAYISVQSPLRYSYEILEQFVDEQPITLRPIITLLSRNIVVQGNITKENVNNHLEYNHLDMSDIPNSFYDANEESLGSRNLGSVLIVQSLYNEPSQVFISGVQFQHIGQTFRRKLSGMNIVGNIFMTGSYIQGCVVLNSFARGLSISGVSGFKVENNIFYNIKGHGILVGEYLEEDIEIKTNLLIKISGSKVLSNTEMLAPAAIYLRAPSNIIEDNTVWSAGYGYLYHLSPDGPSRAPLKSFKKNKAIACLRSGLWLHPEHQPSDFDAVAVIQGFTAWRSRGGIQISRCRNIDFRDFNIYDCKDFGINIIVSNGRITISDSLLLGHIHGKNDGCMKNGIQTPKNFQSVFLYNTTFVNFNMTTCIAISTCTECSKGQGGFTVQIQQLRFLNSPRQVMFPFPHSSLIEDRDGSISGLEGSHLLASVDLLPDSCKENSNITATIPGSVCGSNVVFHRVSIGLRKAPDFNYNLTVINSMNKSIDVNYAEDTLSNLYGWLVLLVDKEKYTIIFDTANMSKELQYSATFDNFGTGNFMLIEHTNLSSLFEIHISCGSKSGQHLQSLPEPLKNSACDWYFDNRQGTVTYLVAGEGRVSLSFSAEQKMAVPTVVPSSQPQSVFKWSSPESWKGVETHWGGYSSSIPLPGDDVIILPNRTIIVDIVLPPLRGLYVLGTLEFPTDASNVLNVTCIIIAGGELRVGTEQKLFEREQSLQIFLRSSEGIHCDRLDSLNVSSGEIGVYGKLQMHSAYASKSWTRLGADIAPGNEMIVLKDTVDWKQGDTIVISSSSYEAHQAEMVQLRESHGHVVRIWEKLIYRHTGDIYNIEDTWELPLSAEVGLLSRNIQIKSDIACSSRIVVGQYKQHNGVEYSGNIHLWNVEISNVGVYPHSSVNFKNTVHMSSIVSSSIHHSCGGGIEAFSSKHILIHANVICNTLGHGIHLTGQNLTLTDNLVTLIKQPKDQSHWVTGIKVNFVDRAIVYGNAVAGSDRIAFHVRGQQCFSEERLLSGNVAHSSLHGVHFYWDDGFQNCTKISGFLSYKNFDYGLIFHLKGDVIIENVILADNSVGLLPVVSVVSSGSYKQMRRHILIQNSLIVGTSPAFDCIMDRIKPLNIDFTMKDRAPRSPFRGRVGILWPIFTSAPKQWPDYPWHKLGSSGAESGIMNLQDVTFSGFTTTCYSNDGDICIMSNPHNIGIMSPITAERTKMTHIKHQNLLYFHSALSSPDCPSSKECYGTQKVLFKDLDGRSLGLTPPVTVFPKSEMESWNSCFNTGIYRKDSKCTYNSDLQGHICQQIDHTVVVLENIGHTTQPISPVLSITSNFIDVFINGNISRDQCCYSTDHPKFYSVLPASKITKVCFNGPTPKAMRLKLNGNQNTTKIVLALFYDTPQSCYISTRGKKIISNLSVTEPTFEKEEHGSSFFSFSKNLLYVVLQGDEPVEIWTNLSIYLAFYVVKGTAMNIHGQLLIELANYFGIDQSQITGLQILQGNVKALRTMTDNHAKKSLHCSTVLSEADEKTHFKYIREMKKNVEYSRHLRSIDVSFLELLIVEIGNPVAPVYHTTGIKLVPLLTYEKLQLIASTVIDDLQTGVLEKLIPMNVDSLMVIEPDDSSFGGKIRNISEPGSETRAFVRPHKIHLQQQPSDGILGLPLAVQPQVIFLDVKGNRVENLGHPLNPWSLAVYLKGYSSKDLKGKSVIPVQDGWGNFSDLAVSSSGSNFYLIINVTSPQGVAFAVQSKEFNIFPVTTGDKENVFMLVVLTSAASVIALFLFLCCFFKRNKIKIKKQIGKRK
ncbi:fibrocystin [Bombina bombina]|uniref:fibrocystin n=1 Tax=Bombina bombina TaxID=8345 RepID=UPI00235A7FF9|nr:fibrocystin [Bombina bombina]